MLATAVWIETEPKPDIRTVIFRDNGFAVIRNKFRANISKGSFIGLRMRFVVRGFKSVSRITIRTTSVNG